MTDLASHLAELEAAWFEKGMPHTRWLNPGLAAGEVEGRLSAAGIRAPQELIDWFSWHDGGVQTEMLDGVRPSLAGFAPLLPLGDAIKLRGLRLEWAASERAVGFPENEEEWGPLWAENWLPLAGAAPHTIFAEINRGSPVVEVTSTAVGSPASDGVRVASLDALVELWLRVVRDLCDWDRTAGTWRYARDDLPNYGVVGAFL